MSITETPGLIECPCTENNIQTILRMRLSPFIAVLLFCICFAIFITLQQKQLMMGISPFQINAMSYVIASTVLSLYIFATNRNAFSIKSSKGLVLGSLVGISISVIADLFVLYGLRVGSSITWSLLSCATPLGTYLLAVLVLNEAVKGNKIGAVFLSIIGALLVIYVPKLGIDFSHGALFFLGAILFYGIGNILSQLALNHITPLQLTLVKLIASALVLLVILAAVHPVYVPVNWFILIFNSMVLLSANVLVNYIIGKAGATYFAIGSNMSPLFVTLLSILLIGVWPTWLQLLGGVVIVGSIMLFQYVRRTSKAAVAKNQ